MWQSEAERASAPASPCRIEDNDHGVSRLASLIFCFSLSLSPMAVFKSALSWGSTRYSFSMSKGVEKSMDLVIGRASWRDRVCQYVELMVGAVSLEKLIDDSISIRRLSCVIILYLIDHLFI